MMTAEMTSTTGLSLVRRIEPRDCGCIVTEAHSAWSKGWLARVELSESGPYDLTRTFLRPDSEDLSRAGNGNKYYETQYLQDGVYEADSVYRSFRSHRVYFQIKDHRVVQVFTSKNAAKKFLAEGE